MKTALKESLVLLVLLLPGIALGHAGHAEPGSVAHGVQHASWLGFAVLAGVIVVLALLSAGSGDDESS